MDSVYLGRNISCVCLHPYSPFRLIQTSIQSAPHSVSVYHSQENNPSGHKCICPNKIH